MRKDHALRGLDGNPVPTTDEIERSIAAARRLRSAVAHDYLQRAAAWVRGLARPAPVPKGPVGQCC
jgi:hypothetical protein